MSRLWLSVKLEMVIRQTKQLVLQDVCVSTFVYLFNSALHVFLDLEL